jgi:hypothetical protein
MIRKKFACGCLIMIGEKDTLIRKCAGHSLDPDILAKLIVSGSGLVKS